MTGHRRLKCGSRAEVEIEIEEIKMEQKKQRMQELVELLNKASKAYYQEATEIMSNFEYDKLYDELLALEEELGDYILDLLNLYHIPISELNMKDMIINNT